ncbi:Glu-tRNA(Gln) amidotransferase subunit GatD [Candidatus Undinarchaeota archaeon]
MVYTGIIRKLLDKYKVQEGDKILLRAKSDSYEGVIMPRTELADDIHIVLKVASGYNTGIEVQGDEKIEKLESRKESKIPKKKIIKDKSKPTVAVLQMGGTIASKVDYRTGGVVPSMTPEEMVAMVPELDSIANFEGKLIVNMESEDLRPPHYLLLAKEIKTQLDNGADAILISHGTDTLHYTAAAMSFMLQFTPSPIVLVGSQRSSDRGSTDATQNLICAAQFAAKADFAGVVVCMHANQSDEYCYIHEGTKVRKLHTSRRDAFRSVNQRPIAKVWPDGKIEFLRNDYHKRDSKRKPELIDKFEEKVALVKAYPGFEPSIITHFLDSGFKGILIEGTGLGHIPITKTDKHTNKNAEIFQNLADFIKSGGIVAMTSQCIYGRTGMDVYSPGRDLQSIGVIPLGDMLPETAYVKLGWALGKSKKPDEVKEIMLSNYSGELTERTDNRTFLI